MLQTKQFLTTTVTSRITQQQKDEIEKLAGKSTTTKSEIVRCLIADQLRKSHEG